MPVPTDSSVRRVARHLAARRRPAVWERLRGRPEAAGVPYQAGSGASLYFRDPDGARPEPLADPLGEMYGARVP